MKESEREGTWITDDEKEGGKKRKNVKDKEQFKREKKKYQKEKEKQKMMIEISFQNTPTNTDKDYKSRRIIHALRYTSSRVQASWLPRIQETPESEGGGDNSD